MIVESTKGLKMTTTIKNKTSYKVAQVIKEYSINYKGYNLIIPIGAKVSNKTASGNDDNYRFLMATREFAQKVTDYPISMLQHDLEYYGLNIPAEFCEPYSL